MGGWTTASLPEVLEYADNEFSDRCARYCPSSGCRSTSWRRKSGHSTPRLRPLLPPMRSASACSASPVSGCSPAPRWWQPDDGKQLRYGRGTAAFLELVPRQYSRRCSRFTGPAKEARNATQWLWNRFAYPPSSSSAPNRVLMESLGWRNQKSRSISLKLHDATVLLLRDWLHCFDRLPWLSIAPDPLRG